MSSSRVRLSGPKLSLDLILDIMEVMSSQKLGLLRLSVGEIARWRINCVFWRIIINALVGLSICVAICNMFDLTLVTTLWGEIHCRVRSWGLAVNSVATGFRLAIGSDLVVRCFTSWLIIVFMTLSVARLHDWQVFELEQTPTHYDKDGVQKFAILEFGSPAGLGYADALIPFWA